ncbi:hypothetical protein BS78_K122000 [Paspalum vaginatum]|uniref:FIGL1 N-terminal domain-containing protein n=1 Tax=Paspalum vaginatum TaxID=158149 RepID=A0A9W7X6J0_9POAL|nr:hypothetical protein BS78_K122000 [Paspalum vaginatum]
MAEAPPAADAASGGGCPTNWRKEADERVRRLHSILFGADAALERGDASASQALALRLLGFLDSGSLAAGVGPEDAAFVAPIRAAASARLTAASRSGAPDSDRAAFELAKKDACVFAKQGDISVETIKCSKYFQYLLQKSKANAADQLSTTYQSFSSQGVPHIVESSADIENEKLSIRASKLMMQTKLTSLYSSIENRTNQNGNRHPAYLEVEEDEKPRGLLQNAKRKHTGFRSPICEVVNSPSIFNDEADVPADEFVSAKTMMVMDLVQKPGRNGPQGASVSPQCDNSHSTRNYGVRPSWNSRRGPRGSFVPPIRSNGGSGTIISRVTGKSDYSMEDSTRKWFVVST